MSETVRGINMSRELTFGVRSSDAEARIGYALARLDGKERFSMTLFPLPDGAMTVEGVDWQQAPVFMQCAGSSEQMTIEVRRQLGDDYQLLAPGRELAGAKPLVETTVSWGGEQYGIFDNEVFDAQTALPIFLEYFKFLRPPDWVTLRPI